MVIPNIPENLAVITTKNILHKQLPISQVWHDKEDGMWQFLDGTELSENDAAVLSLKEILDLDPSIALILDLPLGWMAWRVMKESTWSRKQWE